MLLGCVHWQIYIYVQTVLWFKKKNVLWLTWPWLELGLVRTLPMGPFRRKLSCDSQWRGLCWSRAAPALGHRQRMPWVHSPCLWMLGQLDWLMMFRNWVCFWLGFWYHFEMGKRECSPPVSKWNSFPWKLLTFSSKTWIVKLLPKTRRNFSVFKVLVLMKGWYGKEGVF